MAVPRRAHQGGKAYGWRGDPANDHYRHGRFTCEAIEMRRKLAAWIREMNQLARDIG
jgi:hypothetical protein